jgi:phenylpropionate dioxygenase-like ring-hydroxylating dioxygenase large terminal subunit
MPVSASIDEASGADHMLATLDDGLNRGEIPASLFGNEEIYRRELRTVFSRCWVFLAHEAEISAKGDYVVRKIGEDDFIVVRGDSGEVNVLFDACRHRGVPVCRADSGNTSHFRCPYHGWIYDHRGNLVGAPLWRSALEGISKAENGLIRAPKIASYQGLVFASLDPRACPVDRSGGMR